MATKDYFNIKDFERVYISTHAHKRWKQRVGLLSKAGIAKYISYCARNNKIEHYWDKFYIIDNDIVVRAIPNYNKDNKVTSMTIVTAFGRISENPALNNIKFVVMQKNKYGKMLKKRKDLIS